MHDLQSTKPILTSASRRSSDQEYLEKYSLYPCLYRCLQLQERTTEKNRWPLASKTSIEHDNAAGLQESFSKLAMMGISVEGYQR